MQKKKIIDIKQIKKSMYLSKYRFIIMSSLFLFCFIVGLILYNFSIYLVFFEDFKDKEFFFVAMFLVNITSIPMYIWLYCGFCTCYYFHVIESYGFKLDYFTPVELDEGINKLKELLKSKTDTSLSFISFMEGSEKIMRPDRFIPVAWYINWREYCKDWYSSSLAESIAKVQS